METIERIFATIVCFVCVVGLLLNIIVIFMIYKNKKLRTTNNMLILNLAVGDILKSVVKLIKVILMTDFEPKNRIMPIMLVSLNSWTLAAMSIRYYKSSVYPIYGTKHKISDKKETIIYIAGLWVLCFLLSIPEIIDWALHQDKSQNFKFVSIWNLLNYVILPGGIIIVMFTRTFINVEGNVSIMVGGIHKYWCKKRSKRVLISLTIIFMFCYLPMSLWDVFYVWPTSKKERKLSYIYVYCIYSLSFALNPIAIYCSSNIFRRYFNKTITCSKNERPLSVTPYTI